MNHLATNFQFSAIVLMLILTLMLVFMLFRGTAGDKVPNRTRLIMACGTGLLCLHFMLQYFLRLRELGQTQPLMLNLMLFVPSSWMLNIAVLYLQRQGRLTRMEWLTGATVSLTVIALIAGTTIGDGQPFFCDTPAMRSAVWIAACIYLLMQLYYTYLVMQELRRLRLSLQNYYDRNMVKQLRWMSHCIWVVTSIAITVPIALLFAGKILFIFGLFVLIGICYLVICFRDYVISKQAYQVMTAQQNAIDAGIDTDDDTTPAIDEEGLKRVEQAVNQWIETGNYRRSGITMPIVAFEMHISQPLLRVWYHTAGYESYPDWIQRLRIDYAKKQISEHPEYSLETIAEQSGFSSRNYFHKVFLKLEGKTPAQFAEHTPRGRNNHQS